MSNKTTGKRKNRSMNHDEIKNFINEKYEKSIYSVLCDYIKTPNQSPLFDKEWNTNGYMEQAVKLLTTWVNEQNIPNLEMKVIKENDRTPLIYIEINNEEKTQETVLLYGHLDKQPPMTEYWDPNLGGPWTPVRHGDKLYGRGGADDGYSIFCAVTAINALKQQNLSHARCVILIEASEESGSPDLPYYVDKLANEIGEPSLVICLDSGCGNYEQLWLTTSLRGVAVGTLTVKTITEGVHSGLSSGIVPATQRIMRMVLNRIENVETGELFKDLYVPIPDEHVQYCRDAAKTLGKTLYSEFPWLNGVQPTTLDLTELALNRTWRPTLVVTGVEGIPALQNAGNVMRPYTSFKLSIRLPPSLNPQKPLEEFKKVLESNPPFGAHISFTLDKSASGWVAPTMDKWLSESVSNASKTFYGDNKDVRYMGEGGSIPFMGMLSRKFPQAQFAIMGVLGPKSNAHGPNEFLDLNMAKNLTCCVSQILADHYNNKCS